MVTHHVAEAVILADRVLMIQDGAIVLERRIHLTRTREALPRLRRLREIFCANCSVTPKPARMPKHESDRCGLDPQIGELALRSRSGHLVATRSSKPLCQRRALIANVRDRDDFPECRTRERTHGE
jgi:hypothetical protein